jgi:large conductance mechanosensitive channel
MRKRIRLFICDFKAFAMRGNVFDLAIGVIIGSAFGKITTSLVNDMIMPLIGLLLGGVDFKAWEVTLPNLWGVVYTLEHPAPMLKIGTFIQSVVDFLIIAFCVFVILRVLARLRLTEEKKDGEEAEKQ